MHLNLNMKEVAALAGIDDMTLINWELRGVKPTAEKLRVLTRLYRQRVRGFEISADFLGSG